MVVLPREPLHYIAKELDGLLMATRECQVLLSFSSGPQVRARTSEVGNGERRTRFLPQPRAW